jgi:hypothetical protein
MNIELQSGLFLVQIDDGEVGHTIIRIEGERAWSGSDEVPFYPLPGIEDWFGRIEQQTRRTIHELFGDDT